MSTKVRCTYCVDCGHGAVAVYWGGGGRCQKCSDKWKARIEEIRKREWGAERAALKAHIDGGCPDDGVVCERCCPHDEHDHGICLDCGMDRTEDMVGAAEAYFEGDR